MSGMQTIFTQFGEDTFKRDPCRYKSLKNEEYIYKSCLIPTMYTLAMQPIFKLKFTLAEKLLILYLKNLESRIENHSEMVKFPAELISKAAFNLFDADQIPPVSADVDKNTLFKVSKVMLEKCGAEFTDAEHSEVKAAFEKFPIKGNQRLYQKFVTVFTYALTQLHVFYDGFFGPRNPKDHRTAVIRLFSIQNTYLVLANEVIEKLKEQGIDVSELEEEVKTLGPYATWNFRELAGKVNMKDLDFVKISLDLSDAECLIPISNEGYISASAIFGTSEQPTPMDTETKEIPAEKDLETETSHHGDDTTVGESFVEPTTSVFSSEESSSEDVPNSTTEEPTSESSCIATSSTTKSYISKKKQKKEKKSKKLNAPKEVQPESNSCPKCIRSGEYSRATNEKLRISKIENRHLKKELVNVEMENMEQKEMIEMLKQKLQEKEEDLLKKNTVIEVLEAEKEVLQLENQENKETIKELVEKLRIVKPVTSTMSNQTMELPAPVIDLSENAKDALFTLLNVRNTLKTENPMQKIKEVANQLSEKSQDKQTQITANCEVKLFERETIFYSNAVNSHIKWVMVQSDLPSNWDPCLPEFPSYSQKFQATYKTILKSDPPKICETLLKDSLEELEDTECVICSDDMESFEGTLKCEKCKRRYHDGCIKNWFKVKRTCPMCNESMLDEEEFPQLS
ncbi:unnamed protein product [Caenorhabditis brenneri]